MKNQIVTPATKEDIDKLIAQYENAGMLESANLLRIASNGISNIAHREEPKCCCFEIMGDNKDCPIHGHFFKNEAKARSPFHFDDYVIDSQERNDLYNMGMGR